MDATEHSAIMDRVPLRTIARVTQAGPATSGFAGPGHVAVEVFGSAHFGAADPFVMLMDDRLDFQPGQPVGDAHPHAGLETVTLMLEGSLYDPAIGVLEAGDLEWMTAGRGIVHSEGLRATGWARILQLWIALPSASRFAEPDLQVVPLGALPVRREPGVEARLYSGRTGGLVSPTRNRVPVTLVDYHLDALASVDQELAGAEAGFVYVIAGGLSVGDRELGAGDVGWLEPSAAAESMLRLTALSDGVRAILYAGAPIHEPVVQRGPFVAGSLEEISGFHGSYLAGRFQRLSGMSEKLEK